MTDSTLTRRERVRRQTLDEIRQHALAQIADGGSAALSLNAIAKAMGMSGPAIYRYFASREELLAALVTDGYGELTATLEQAAAAAARRAPIRRLAAVADAYRAWALAHPHRYELLFGVRPAGYADPGEAIAAIHGSMRVLLELLGEIAVDQPRRPPAGKLDAQLARWAARRALAAPAAGPAGAERRAVAARGAAGPGRAERRSVPASAAADPSPLVLRLGVLTWTRLHGIVSLELAGVFGDMGIDAGLLSQAELDAIVDEAIGAG